MEEYILEATELNAQYDACAKKLLSEKIILAHILKGTVSEFANMQPEDIIPLIEGEPLISKVRVEPGMTNASYNKAISGINAESGEIGEGKILFDILFYVQMPDGLSKIVINIEAQKKEKPGYPLINRSIFYGSRLISSQKERDFIKSNYGDMVRTYSIWLCFNLDENCMNRLQMENKPMIGNHEWDGDIDLLNIVLIGLNKDLSKETLEKSESDLHYMLGTIFSNQITTDEKIKLLNTKTGMPDGNGIREEMEEMCNLSYGIAENAMEKGLEKGKTEERLSIIIKMLNNNFSTDQIKLCTNASNADIEKAMQISGAKRNV